MDASLVEVSLASIHQGVLALALQLVYVLSAGGRPVGGLYLRTIKERSVYPSTLGRESRSMAKSLYGRARRMFSEILVDSDGSETGKKALVNAIEMKKLYNTQLTVMHVVETAIRRPYTTYVEKSVVTGELAPPLAALSDSGLTKTLLRAAPVLEEARLIAEKEGVKPRIVLRDGEPATEILREASRNFDLIILGFRGQHPSGIGLGSVVNRVVTNASCSVLVIR